MIWFRFFIIVLKNLRPWLVIKIQQTCLLIYFVNAWGMCQCMCLDWHSVCQCVCSLSLSPSLCSWSWSSLLLYTLRKNACLRENLSSVLNWKKKPQKTNKQTNKQTKTKPTYKQNKKQTRKIQKTNKQTNKQINKQANKQTNKQIKNITSSLCHIISRFYLNLS